MYSNIIINNVNSGFSTRSLNIFFFFGGGEPNRMDLPASLSPLGYIPVAGARKSGEYFREKKTSVVEEVCYEPFKYFMCSGGRR